MLKLKAELAQRIQYTPESYEELCQVNLDKDTELYLYDNKRNMYMKVMQFEKIGNDFWYTLENYETDKVEENKLIDWIIIKYTKHFDPIGKREDDEDYEDYEDVSDILNRCIQIYNSQVKLTEENNKQWEKKFEQLHEELMTLHK